MLCSLYLWDKNLSSLADLTRALEPMPLDFAFTINLEASARLNAVMVTGLISPGHF